MKQDQKEERYHRVYLLRQYAQNQGWNSEGLLVPPGGGSALSGYWSIWALSANLGS